MKTTGWRSLILYIIGAGFLQRPAASSFPPCSAAQAI